MPSENELLPSKKRSAVITIPAPKPEPPLILHSQKELKKSFTSMAGKSVDDSESKFIKPEVAPDSVIPPKSQSFFNIIM